MSYIAINVNYKMDMDWYHRCGSVSECMEYFRKLEVGDGEETAIYDVNAAVFVWINDKSINETARLERIVADALKKNPGDNDNQTSN